MHPKIFSILNLIAVLIPVFLLFVFLKNPEFGDPLLLVAVIGAFFMIGIILLGIIFILLRKHFQSEPKYYFAMGVLAFFSGIAGIITEISLEFETKTIPYIVALLCIGLFIIINTFANNKNSLPK